MTLTGNTIFDQQPSDRHQQFADIGAADLKSQNPVHAADVAQSVMSE
jgi:hypothetical protein